MAKFAEFKICFFPHEAKMPFIAYFDTNTKSGTIRTLGRSFGQLDFEECSYIKQLMTKRCNPKSGR